MTRALLSMLVLVVGVSAMADTSKDYHIVKSAQQFILGPAGYAGIISDEEKAFGALCKAPDAADLFRRILREGGTAGKMYALFGLRQVGALDYKHQADRLRNSTAMVETVSGCIVERHKVSYIVTEWIDKMPLKKT
jgi:hypothetical protein